MHTITLTDRQRTVVLSALEFELESDYDELTQPSGETPPSQTEVEELETRFNETRDTILAIDPENERATALRSRL